MTAVDERPHYRTAEQELSDSLEGTAPALSRTVAGLIGPARTAELAGAIARATDLAVRRHAMNKLADALAVVEEAIGGIPPECESAEPARGGWWHSSDAEPCESGLARPDDALCEGHGRLVVKAGENGWPFAPDPDEAEQQARVDRFMAGGNDA